MSFAGYGLDMINTICQAGLYGLLNKNELRGPGNNMSIKREAYDREIFSGAMKNQMRNKKQHSGKD